MARAVVHGSEFAGFAVASHGAAAAMIPSHPPRARSRSAAILLTFRSLFL